MASIQHRPLARDDLARKPLTQFARWYEEACARDAFEPDAMALATAAATGAPSVRMVLMKGFDDGGISFFTNYGSRKAVELETNPRAALLFHWPELGRQVRVEGSVGRVERAESVAYARSRSRSSQLSALASPQSRPVPSRRWLEERVAALDREYRRGELPVSEEWGGYRLQPAAWEFWQHRSSRLHDRFRYELTPAGAWTIERLGP
ncbi:MAG: pyridoxamine 5'-phosphate oxidase [Thermoleophilaceae bacterium]|nr:pyridoxamine 5'-phosphate oxidase [Thermoleophilaceae bacterium]